jgi:beta-glucosidase
MIDDTSLSARVNELMAAMTPAEKSGQLTQYFYFGSPAETVDLPDVDGVPATPSAAVEAAMGRGEVGSLLFVTDPAETNRLQRLTIDGNRHGIPALFGFDVIHGVAHDLPSPDGDGGVVGPGDRRAGAGCGGA